MGLSMGGLFGGGGDPFHSGLSLNTPFGGLSPGSNFGRPNPNPYNFNQQWGSGPFSGINDPTSNGLFSGGGASRAGWYLQHPGQIIPGAYDVLTGQEQPMTTYNRNAAYAQGQAQTGANAGRSYAASRGLTGGLAAGTANQAAQGPLMQWLNSQQGMSGGNDFMNMLMQIMMMSGYGG